LAAVKRVSCEIERLGLEPYSFHAPFADHIDITALDAAKREAASKELECAAAAAATLKVTYFVVHPGPEKASLPESERIQRLENAAGVLERAENYCRQLRIGLVLENMLPHLFAGRVRDLLWIIGALRTTNIGVCLDTGHAHLGERIATVAQKLSGHLWMVHASDNRGHYDDHLPPGDGTIDWQSFLTQLAAMHFTGTIILELAGGAEHEVTLQAARRARIHLRTLGHLLRLKI
jgi:sugar phosphate isomerase/epimerase